MKTLQFLTDVGADQLGVGNSTAARMSTFVAVLILAVLLILRAGYGDALVSRGTMSSCVPYYLNPPHRVVMLGDRLSWDSADYKIFEALESLTTVEDAVFVQVDEVDEDLLALQLRNFDPDTVLVSVRTRAFENLPWTVLQIVRTQCRRRHEIVVLVFHLHAHAIPPSDRAFASIRRAGHVVDSYESRAMGRWHDPRTSLEVLQLHVDELGPLDADDLLAGRLSLEWFGQTVPVRMCSAMSCAHIPCAGSSALHEIIVFVGAANCSALSGDEKRGCCWRCRHCCLRPQPHHQRHQRTRLPQRRPRGSWPFAPSHADQ